MASLNVELGSRSYPIFIDADLIQKEDIFLPYIRGSKIVVVSNTTVAPLYLATLLKTLNGKTVTSIIIPDGETHKTLEQYAVIMTALLEQQAARDTTLIALGGGVVGDICGFVAATYQRGVPFIQVPTTLLSQVDSSVGGKTAVNHPLGKNMIGAFYQPKSVIIDISTLSTLPQREWSAGMAEVIKYGIINDEPFFRFLEENAHNITSRDRDTLVEMISRCCHNKAAIVAADEQEQNVRALLNLGHTFGHAIEAELGFGTWLHGEAVAAGMTIACKVAQKLGWQGEDETQRVVSLLNRFSLPTWGPEGMTAAHYIRHMKHDKKVDAGQITFIIPKGIGRCVVTKDVPEPILFDVLG